MAKNDTPIVPRLTPEAIKSLGRGKAQEPKKGRGVPYSAKNATGKTGTLTKNKECHGVPFLDFHGYAVKIKLLITDCPLGICKGTLFFTGLYFRKFYSKVQRSFFSVLYGQTAALILSYDVSLAFVNLLRQNYGRSRNYGKTKYDSFLYDQLVVRI